MSVTIKDVAREACVSIGTVSLAINDNPLVKQETKIKVLDTIARLGYVPNQYARSLITKVTKVIGAIKMDDVGTSNGLRFNESPSIFFSESLLTLESAIAERNYSTIMDKQNLMDPGIPKIVSKKLVDGIICIGGIVGDDFLNRIRKAEIPTVLLGAQSPLFDYSDADAEDGEYQATKYILEKGHRRIAFMNGPTSSKTTGKKLNGFLKAVAEAGLKNESDYAITNCASYSGESSLEACRIFGLSHREKRFTAYVCASDTIALGVYRYCHENHLRCPDDVSIIGYEDGMLAEYATPALTTIKVNKKKLAIEACNILFNRLQNPKARHVGYLCKGTLIERDSVGSPKSH